MSVGINPDTKYRIIEDFQKTGNKTKTASLFGVSARTVGRIVKEYDWVVSNEPYKSIFEDMNILVMPDNVIDDCIVTDQEYAEFDLICNVNGVYVDDKAESVIQDFIENETDTFETVFNRAYNSRYLTGTGTQPPVGVVSFGPEPDEEFDTAEPPEDETTPLTENYGDVDAYEWNLIATAQSITVTKTDKETSETESVEIAKGTDKFRNAWGIIREIDMSDEDQVAIGADEIYAMADPKSAIEKFSQGRLTVDVKTETIYYDGNEVHNNLTDRIIDLIMNRGVEGGQVLLNFLEKLMENPSYRAVNALYDFLAHNDIEIADNGNFYAWKRVRANYTDCHTGKIDNSVGAEPSLPRNMVDENMDRTCSHGLHVAAKHYLHAFHGPITLKCEVDPRDVVAIPKDYQNSKMRTCRYKVVEDVSSKFDY